MAIHTPVVQRARVPAFPNLVPAALAVILLAVLATVLLLAQGATTPATSQGMWDLWMTRDRHGEIDTHHSGPNADVLQFRHGEINAGG